jgi:hypothetical protein
MESESLWTPARPHKKRKASGKYKYNVQLLITLNSNKWFETHNPNQY